ncbi:hypothetical protein VMCG_08117 [Cytospora schulzeri]|uniref:Mid2 domain-containing protein n=1 Tax=Cytospora schulzeri TaxID=448051 RepID=A0A423VRA2_9PEZI|nr:hypothetical protein VMCG_08117 [Valsa malicola]
MAFTITEILFIALYVATWANSLPTMPSEAPACGRENFTDDTSLYLDCSGLLDDLDDNDNSNANADTDPSITAFCSFDYSCCRTTGSCHNIGKCFDNGPCSNASGCDVPGPSASTTSTFTCRDSAPTQTCAASLITAGAPAGYLTFACFDIRTRAADVVQPGASRITPMPILESFPIISDSDLASDSTSDADRSLLAVVTKTLEDVDTFPFGTSTETYISALSEYAPLVTETPPSSSADPASTIAVSAYDSSAPASTSQTTVQATPTNTSPKTKSSAANPNRTAIVAGGLFGTVAFLAISITSVDYLVKRIKNNRCRQSISDSSSDSEALTRHKDESQMTAYGYYGTNRAGVVPKGSKVLEANLEPAELPAENVAKHRK